MIRKMLFTLTGLVAILAIGLTIRCAPAPPGGDGDGATPVCAEAGEACEADADCCEGLSCVERTCEPSDGDVGDVGRVEHPGGVATNHLAAAAFDSVPTAYIDIAQTNFRIFYGHTSHGSQVVTGLNMQDTGSGTLSIEENDGVDLGHAGDLAWVDITREVLDRPGGDINIVMWSWCGGVSDNTEAGIDAYLDAMDQLETDYPDVVFVYMTGHLDGTGADGNLRTRNNQIRDYCTTNDKLLFDFADIESYDPDGTFYPDGSDWCEWCETWCAANTCPDLDCVDDADCAHSVCFNCYQKGAAAWWMMARIAGWSGSPDDTGPPDTDTTPDDDDGSGDATSTAEGGRPTERLGSTDLTYQGAFRLPENFYWGALGLSYYPDGDGGAGSLLVSEFEALTDVDHSGVCWNPEWDCYAYYGEVTIPAPARSSNWEDLPEATLATGPTAFDGGLASTVHNEYLNVSDLEFVPRRGTQTSDKLYGSINLWYAEGVAGEGSFPTVWFANMDGTGARGMFHVGPDDGLYHGRKMGAYLFSVPQWYADEYLGGRTLITGRSRGTPGSSSEEVTTEGGSQGPTLFAFHPWESDSPTGDLDALPILYYRVKFPGCAGPNVGSPAACDYPDYTLCDDWSGGAFVDDGDRRALMLLGYKGLGTSCYDEPPVECNDPCSDSHGYHCDPYERQVVFYDVHELGYSAQGGQDPWVVIPYETWRPDEFYLQDNPCTNAGGMTFDEAGGRLFMVERGLGGVDTNATVVHVWSL